MDLTLCKGTLSFPNMGVSFQTGATMVEAYSCLECLCQSSWLKLTEKHSQKHYTSCYQPNFPFGTSGRSRSSAIHQTPSSPSDYWGKKSMSHHSRDHISTVWFQSRFTPLRPTLGIAHCDLRIVCSCLSMETYSMKPPQHSSIADVTSRVLQQRIEFLLTTQYFSTRWPHPVRSRELPLCV